MIDRERKLIFVHSEKSGGTSVERAFGAQIVKPGEPQPDSACLVWQEQVLSATGYQQRYPEEWASFRKIAIVRNPADRVVSRHRYFLRSDKALASVLADKTDSNGVCADLLRADIRYVSRGTFENHQIDKLGPLKQYDFILRLEHIREQWPAMIEKLGLEGLPEHLPHTNSSGDIVQILDIVTEPHLRGKLAVALRRDLDAFRYTVDTVTKAEQQAILKAMAGGCKGAACDMLAYLERVYPVAD